MKTPSTPPAPAAHTPTPWSVKETYQGALSDKFKGFPFVIEGGGFQPCLIYGDGTENRGTALANARLIAAAPDLLAALEKQACLTAYYNGHSDGYKPHPNGGLFWEHYLCPEARAAIAKATQPADNR